MSNRRYVLNILLDLPVNTQQSVIDYYNNLPKSVHMNNDSGVDIMVPCDIVISNTNNENDKFSKINHYIKCCMYDKTTNTPVAYYMYSRSSIYKYNLSVANSVGIIDMGYRGHLISVVYNMDFNNSTNINGGTRLFQICAPDLSPLDVKIVTSLPESVRGENGLGSTGK